MPARQIIPNYDTFGQVLHDSGIFGRAIHYRDVVASCSTRCRRRRSVNWKPASAAPARFRATDGRRRTAAFIDTLNQPEIERKVSQLFRRNRSHLVQQRSRSTVRRAVGASLGIR